MSMAPPEYADSLLEGRDVSWLAVDRDGHVAWLVTFGSGVVPTWLEDRVRESQGRDLDVIEDVEEMLAALSERSDVLSGSSTDQTDAEWAHVARLGIFAFDWRVYTGPYQAVASPKSPVHVDELPPTLARLAKRSCFSHLCFAEGGSIGVADVERCAPFSG